MHAGCTSANRSGAQPAARGCMAANGLRNGCSLKRPAWTLSHATAQSMAWRGVVLARGARCTSPARAFPCVAGVWCGMCWTAARMSYLHPGRGFCGRARERACLRWYDGTRKRRGHGTPLSSQCARRVPKRPRHASHPLQWPPPAPAPPPGRVRHPLPVPSLACSTQASQPAPTGNLPRSCASALAQGLV